MVGTWRVLCNNQDLILIPQTLPYLYKWPKSNKYKSVTSSIAMSIDALVGNMKCDRVWGIWYLFLLGWISEKNPRRWAMFDADECGTWLHAGLFYRNWTGWVLRSFVLFTSQGNHFNTLIYKTSPCYVHAYRVPHATCRTENTWNYTQEMLRLWGNLLKEERKTITEFVR